MTGDSEFPAGEMWEIGGGEDGSAAPDGGAKKPTLRTLGSITARVGRRESITQLLRFGHTIDSDT